MGHPALVAAEASWSPSQFAYPCRLLDDFTRKSIKSQALKDDESVGVLTKNIPKQENFASRYSPDTLSDAVGRHPPTRYLAATMDVVGVFCSKRIASW
jgi:hypothetical protein